ncbi:MAG TPA: 23S rRNA (adenine(2503)-C(2))-methyltransferase RlmN [Sedimentisphaerales bacterium]|nr:23S rRNA (adenine(2503)-C(2))-methyltransferase RlmN [Sedimentisphaerales bacterium]
MVEENKDIKNMTLAEIGELVEGFGQKKYLAKYIYGFIHVKDAREISDLSTLSKQFRDELVEKGYYISEIKLVEKLEDPDGTKKYLFELGDGLKIESVLLFDDSRRTLCISTQVGCWMGCGFCATAKLGFTRDLSAAEIVDQVNFVSKDECRVSNVVYMGMGEPLNNYENVIKSIEILNCSAGKNLGIRHITVSTCGVADGIEKLADEELKPRLAVSLNAPVDAIRSSIMPVNKKFKLAYLFKALKDYQFKTGNRVTFEYVMIKDVNDSNDNLDQLIRLVRTVKCNVNLIEYNPHQGCDFLPSSRATIKDFAKKMQNEGIETTIRLKMGQTIKGACGQLGADRIASEKKV